MDHFFPQYVALFVLGMVAYRADWLLRIPRAFGLFRFGVALIAGPALWVGVTVGGRIWLGDYSRVAGGLHGESGLYCVWESLFCTGFQDYGGSCSFPVLGLRGSVPAPYEKGG